MDQESLLLNLKYLDLAYGSVENDSFEDPKLEYDCLEACVAYFELKTEGGIPLKAEWLRLFSGITPKAIADLGAPFVRENGWDEETGVALFMEYLRSVRPVVKDLKENADAIFARWYGGVSEPESQSAKSMLLERARKHTIEYKGTVPPVL